MLQSRVLSSVEDGPRERLRKFRKAERARMIEDIRDLIDVARKRATSEHTLSRERVKWMRLAGQLIWYKDQILRGLSYEALEEEVGELRELVIKKKEDEMRASSQPQTVMRRTIRTDSMKTRPRTDRRASRGSR